MKCPGQDSRFWKPEDVFEIQCLKCGWVVEFFKDDVKRKCRCGQEIVNPRLDFGCAQWCEYGDQCLVVIPPEFEELRQELERGRFKEKFSQTMKRYFGKDLKRILHAQKVARFAEEMVKGEGGNPLVVLGSAFLHDIGIHEAEKKHGSSSEEFQELEGPPIAKEMLKRLGLRGEMIEEVCDIIGHHHHPREEETLNFQILYEADWLVNIEENGFLKDREKLEPLIDKVFKTVTGKRLAKDLYLNSPAKN